MRLGPVAPFLVLACISCSRSDGPFEGQTRGAVAPYLGGRFPERAASWRVVNAFPNLEFDDAVGLLPVPGTDRLVVLERQGRVWTFRNDPAVRERSLFMDLFEHCQGWDDSGLLGMAFHPEFGKAGSPNRGYVYVYYVFTEKPTRGPGRPTKPETPLFDRLSRFTVPDGAAAVDPKSELVLIDQHDDHYWHNGGGLTFHPRDGFLYLSMGDEGGEFGNEQRIDKDLHSGVLRIDVDRDPKRSHPAPRQPADGKTAHYFIPNDNPWVGVAGALEEFYAIGFRSPHRMTVDPVTGKIWIGELGGILREEIDVLEKGGNYGWRYMEGTLRQGPTPKPLIGREVAPFFEYGRRMGASVIGGYIYRGSRFPELKGKYVFADWQGPVFALDPDPGADPRVETLCPVPPPVNVQYGAAVSSFGFDHAGELYLCRMGHPGGIYRLDRTKSAGPPPKRLSETGIFRDLATLAPADGLIFYDLNVPAYLDGATARRWVAIPNDGAPYGPDERAGFAPTGEWSFPPGTVFVQNVAWADGRPVETRVLVVDADGGAYPLKYVWKDGDAVLEEGPSERDGWKSPSLRDCRACHNPAAGHVLGVNTRQLNRDGQLEAWAAAGLCVLPKQGGSGLARLVSPDDARYKIEDRVRAYLDVNCSGCHRPGGTHAYFDARWDTPPEKRAIVGGGLVNRMGMEKGMVVAPADVSNSMMPIRLSSVDPTTRMPPVGRHTPDAKAVALILEWIRLMTK